VGTSSLVLTCATPNASHTLTNGKPQNPSRINAKASFRSYLSFSFLSDYPPLLTLCVKDRHTEVATEPMDPLSAIGAASSVVGVASFGIQLSQAFYQFTSQALSAKESLQTILSGVHETACALNQVHGILVEECEYRERKGRAILFSAKAIEDVRGTADKCLFIFWLI
jgi:hypothetical protein